MRKTTKLYPNEERYRDESTELIFYKECKHRKKPLMVFVPGGFHTGRIAYGHPESKRSDFLAYWALQSEHNFISISYPIATTQKLIDNIDPEFGIESWAKLISRITRDTIEKHDLANEVIVLAWSMAGNTAVRINQAFSSDQVNLKLFVSLAATPPIPGLTLGSQEKVEMALSREAVITEASLLSQSILGSRKFWGQVDEMNRINTSQIISQETYQAEFVGDIPLNLMAAMPSSIADNAVTIGYETILQSSGGLEFAEYPPVAAIIPEDVTDARHALTDLYNWGFILTNMLYSTEIETRLTSITKMDKLLWAKLTSLVNEAPRRLTTTIEGNHFFFIGEEGARKTIEKTCAFTDEWLSFRQQLDSIILQLPS